MKTLFQCEICQTIFEEKEKAEKCENKEKELPQFEVGEIVFAKAGFAWFDGDRNWISNPENIGKARTAEHGNCFGSCCTLQFYYVVTAIDYDKHCIRYYLATDAMTGNQGYCGGYTYSSGHVAPKKVEIAPEYVLKSSRKLIGQKIERLFS